MNSAYALRRSTCRLSEAGELARAPSHMYACVPTNCDEITLIDDVGITAPLVVMLNADRMPIRVVVEGVASIILCTHRDGVVKWLSGPLTRACRVVGVPLPLHLEVYWRGGSKSTYRSSLVARVWMK